MPVLFVVRADDKFMNLIFKLFREFINEFNTNYSAQQIPVLFWSLPPHLFVEGTGALQRGGRQERVVDVVPVVPPRVHDHELEAFRGSVHGECPVAAVPLVRIEGIQSPGT